jgi:hypothetical protein
MYQKLEPGGSTPPFGLCALPKGQEMTEAIKPPGVFFPSFREDCCVIEEQEDHLVLAVRIPKATIAANLALFSAFADLTKAA